eukprot:388069-Prymnesium_polylepis.1
MGVRVGGWGSWETPRACWRGGGVGFDLIDDAGLPPRPRDAAAGAVGRAEHAEEPRTDAAAADADAATYDKI